MIRSYAIKVGNEYFPVITKPFTLPVRASSTKGDDDDEPTEHGMDFPVFFLKDSLMKIPKDKNASDPLHEACKPSTKSDVAASESGYSVFFDANSEFFIGGSKGRRQTPIDVEGSTLEKNHAVVTTVSQPGKCLVESNSSTLFGEDDFRHSIEPPSVSHLSLGFSTLHLLCYYAHVFHMSYHHGNPKRDSKDSGDPGQCSSSSIGGVVGPSSSCMKRVCKLITKDTLNKIKVGVRKIQLQHTRNAFSDTNTDAYDGGGGGSEEIDVILMDYSSMCELMNELDSRENLSVELQRAVSGGGIRLSGKEMINNIVTPIVSNGPHRRICGTWKHESCGGPHSIIKDKISQCVDVCEFLKTMRPSTMRAIEPPVILAERPSKTSQSIEKEEKHVTFERKKPTPNAKSSTKTLCKMFTDSKSSTKGPSQTNNGSTTESDMNKPCPRENVHAIMKEYRSILTTLLEIEFGGLPKKRRKTTNEKHTECCCCYLME
jgi:hypothetical protein